MGSYRGEPPIATFLTFPWAQVSGTVPQLVITRELTLIELPPT
jgi:hypothetical protein